MEEPLQTGDRVWISKKDNECGKKGWYTYKCRDIKPLEDPGWWWPEGWIDPDRHGTHIHPNQSLIYNLKVISDARRLYQETDSTKNVTGENYMCMVEQLVAEGSIPS